MVLVCCGNTWHLVGFSFSFHNSLRKNAQHTRASSQTWEGTPVQEMRYSHAHLPWSLITQYCTLSRSRKTWVPHGSGCCEAQAQGANGFGIWRRPLSGLSKTVFLFWPYIPMAKNGMGVPCGSLLLWPQHLLISSPHWGLISQPMNRRNIDVWFIVMSYLDLNS